MVYKQCLSVIDEEVDEDAEIFTRGDQDGQDWKWADQRDS